MNYLKNLVFNILVEGGGNMILNWDNSFSVGEKNIDNQHKELFYRLNKLLEAMKQGKGKSEVINTLDFLEEYVIRHKVLS